MTVSRFLEWFQLGALTCLLCLGIGRAVALYARGVRVIAVDRQRTLAQGLADLTLLILMLAWAYEIVAWAWPLPTHVLPRTFGTVVVDGAAFQSLGVAVVIAGLLLHGCALWVFADSWRIGIDRETHGPLVTGGVFAWTRNPIYVALDLQVIGSFLVLGRLVFLALALPILLLLHGQILREERFLARVYGDVYREYRGRVARYLGWL